MGIQADFADEVTILQHRLRTNDKPGADGLSDIDSFRAPSCAPRSSARDAQVAQPPNPFGR